MRNILEIAKRELAGYFATPIGWIILCLFLVLTGFFFASMVGYFAMQTSSMAMNPYESGNVNLGEYLISPFYSNMGVILLMVCPIISMRLLSEDRRSRSMELLLTSPVSTTEIVVGKYLGGMGFVAVLLLATAHYPVILYWLGSPDTGIVLCSYLSMLLLVGSFMAVGILTSAFTESQVAAAVGSFAILLLFWVASWADSSTSGAWSETLSYISMLSHMEQIGKGLIHLKDIVYYATFILVALFATHQRVEAYRWR